MQNLIETREEIPDNKDQTFVFRSTWRFEHWQVLDFIGQTSVERQ